ncbi:hypothetical protein ANCCEY_10922 [Ancylostoma ceylanicum]|uniref:Acyltransferase 3 domain-containing protein n=1 Tax=Ancylostoma ceylanicum TaxID=53326 RepID=A0A0D6LQQ0_9BILA|nr:hypothetical protein ANCCEY_10922 [Ancylostoma ceylanicum]
MVFGTMYDLFIYQKELEVLPPSERNNHNLIPTLINFPKRFYTQVIVQAPLAVDSFFLLSGLLASYIFFKKLLKDKTIRNPRNPLMWLMIYVKRYTRITPTYAVIMLFDVTLFTYVSSGPFWRPIERQGCRFSWWTNFLYMNNFLLQHVECCMGWTWYLANDVQFHYVIAPILFIAFAKNIRWGLLLGIVMLVASSIIKLWIIFENDFPPAPILTAKLQMYEIAWYNPFYTVDGVKWVMLGWCMSTVLGLYSVFGLYEYARTGDISERWRALYVVAGRNSYALAVGWVAFACATGNGGPVGTFLSWKFFMPLSKITFCAYLLHPIMLQIYNFSRPQPFHFTTFFQMLQHTFEAIFVSYLLAFFFALAFEKPFTVFDEMLMPVKSRTSARRKSIELKASNGETEPLKT